MRQAFHIFKKDVYYLKREIGLLLVLAVALAWGELHSRNGSWVEVLLTAAAVYLIARVIHAEALPGDRQFWITRPYRRSSLLGAKLLFVIVCVNAPIFLARLYVIAAAGLPLSVALPRLVWSQFLMFAGASLPVAALAALTPSLVPFLFAMLILLAAGLGMQEMLAPPFKFGSRELLLPMQWLWGAIAFIAAASAALAVIWLQYKNRQTLVNMIVAAGIALSGAVAYLYVPWPAAAAVQGVLSKQAIESSSISLTGAGRPRSRLLAGRLGDNVEVDFPLAVRVPAEFDFRADAFSLAIMLPNGAGWKTGPYRFSTLSEYSAKSTFYANVLLPAAFFAQHRNEPAAVDLHLYVTLFGNPKSRTIPLRPRPVNAAGGLQCSMSSFSQGLVNQLFCMSPFRWPAGMTYVKFDNGETEAFREVTYSPFPAGMDFTFSEARAMAAPKSAMEATIIVKEPLAHVRRDITLRDIHLADFAPR